MSRSPTPSLGHLLGTASGPGLSSVCHRHPGAKPGSAGASCIAGGPLRAGTGPSVSSDLLHHSIGGHCPLLMASCHFSEALMHLVTHSLITECLLHLIPGAAQGAAGSGEHCRHPQLFASQGEGHEVVEWTVRDRALPGLGAPEASQKNHGLSRARGMGGGWEGERRGHHTAQRMRASSRADPRRSRPLPGKKRQEKGVCAKGTRITPGMGSA